METNKDDLKNALKGISFKDTTEEEIKASEEKKRDEEKNKLSTIEQVVFFLIPIIGLIVYAISLNSYPEKAKQALNISIAGIVLGTLAYFALTMKVA